MSDTERLQVLIGIQSALLGEAVPSLYAVTFEMHKPLLYVYWYMDSDVTDEIENHYYGFMAALHDQISDDFWMAWDLHHAIKTVTNDSKFSCNVVYLRRTDMNVSFNSSIVQINTLSTSCKQTVNRFQMCTLSSENILGKRGQSPILDRRPLA